MNVNDISHNVKSGNYTEKSKYFLQNLELTHSSVWIIGSAKEENLFQYFHSVRELQKRILQSSKIQDGLQHYYLN